MTPPGNDSNNGPAEPNSPNADASGRQLVMSQSLPYSIFLSNAHCRKSKSEMNRSRTIRDVISSKFFGLSYLQLVVGSFIRGAPGLEFGLIRG